MHSDATTRAGAVRTFLDEFVGRLEPLELDFNRAQWESSTTGSDAAADRRAVCDTAIRTLLSDPGACAEARALRAGGSTGDALLDRELEVLERHLAAHQMPAATIERLVALETALDSTFNNFRATVGGRALSDNELRLVLHASDDVAERRAAWEASKQVGAEAAPRLLELVRLRNEAARALGHRDFYAMMLTLDELDEDELVALLDRVDAGTRAPFERYRRALDEQLDRRFGVKPADVRPWHLADPFFQEAPVTGVDLDPYFTGLDPVEIVGAFFAAIGLELAELVERSDLYERPGKSQHAFCLSVDRAADVRVLCNLQPNEHWTATLLHEMGHAVYDRGIDRSLPWLLRTPAHTLTTEAIAMLFGRLTRAEAWLARWVGVDAREAARLGAELDRATREQQLVATRWKLVMCHMERALYADPGRDLASHWWNLVERCQLVRRPDTRHAPDWASKIHFSLAPVYYHNYLLGEILASQFERSLLALAPTGVKTDEAWRHYVTEPATGAWLAARVFAPGKSVDWRTLVQRATGAPFAADAYVDWLAAE